MSTKMSLLGVISATFVIVTLMLVWAICLVVLERVCSLVEIFRRSATPPSDLALGANTPGK